MKAVPIIAVVGLSLAWQAAASGAQDLTPAKIEAEAVIQQFQQAMMGELKRAIEKGGMAGATSICRNIAPAMAAKIGEQTGWSVRRVATRARNPVNLPDDDERGVLNAYETRLAVGQSFTALTTTRLGARDGEPVVHYMSAIPVIEPCLACHGETIAPDVAAAIRTHYPKDDAVGYKLGELRGAFSLRKPLKAIDTKAALSASSLPDSALAAWAARPEVRTIGDARLGRQHFRQFCSGCHADRDLAAGVFKSSDEDEKRKVCRFLETHGATDQGQDCNIVAYLKAVSLSARAK